MSASKKITLSNLLYILIFIGAAIYFSSMKFTGSDAAGNGLEAGLTLLLGITILVVLAIIFVIYNLVACKKSKNMGLKFFSFVPILIPVLIFGFQYVGIGQERPVPINEQSHKFTIEFKSVLEANTARYSWRSDGGGGSSKIRPTVLNDSLFNYKASCALFYNRTRTFQISLDDYESGNFELPIAHKLAEIPYTPWQNIKLIDTLKQDTVLVEFRYQIEKMPMNDY